MNAVEMRDQGSSERWPHWTTPKPIADRAKIALGGIIDLDPCSNVESIIDARIKCYIAGVYRDGQLVTTELTGLSANWKLLIDSLEIDRRGTAYVNCDYNHIAEWVRKCIYFRDWLDIILCVPSRTSSGWYHHALAGTRILGLYGPGRVEFGNPPPTSDGKSPSIASSFFYMGQSPDLFREAFRDCCALLEWYR